MKRFRMLLISACFSLNIGPMHAQERVELDTTVIKGNTELPKYLYVVPWQDRKSEKKVEQKLVLHNLYGDLFDPVLPPYIPVQDFKSVPVPDERK